MVKNPPAMQKTQIGFLGQEDPLERKQQPTPVLLSTGLQKNQIQLSDYTTTNWGMINTYSGEA